MILEKCVLSLRVGSRVGVLTGSFDATKGRSGEAFELRFDGFCFGVKEDGLKTGNTYLQKITELEQCLAEKDTQIKELTEIVFSQQRREGRVRHLGKEEKRDPNQKPTDLEQCLGDTKR